jgi:hypothetical protein
MYETSECPFTPPYIAPKRGLNRLMDVRKQAFATLNLTVASFALYGIDRLNPATPEFLQGRIVDTVGTTANAALLDTIYGVWDDSDSIRTMVKNTRFERVGYFFADNRPLKAALYAFVSQVNWEVMQGIGVIPGTYDPGDIVAYGVGALSWVGLNMAGRFVQNHFRNSSPQPGLSV